MQDNHANLQHHYVDMQKKLQSDKTYLKSKKKLKTQISPACYLKHARCYFSKWACEIDILTCNFHLVYVVMQFIYVNKQLCYVDMRNKYVDMQIGYVDFQNKYGMQLFMLICSFVVLTWEISMSMGIFWT